MFVKLHHSIADGMAAMAAISAFLDAAPDASATSTPPWTPAPPPSGRALFADNLGRHLRKVARTVSALVWPRTTLRHVRAAWPAIRELLAEEPASRTSLDRIVGPARRLAVIRTSLDEVKEIAHAHGGTVNDVLLAATAGGLGKLLRARENRSRAPRCGSTSPSPCAAGPRSAAGQPDRADGGPARHRRV
jgi:diacylglycerol O-acyltransferase / wax synthase